MLNLKHTLASDNTNQVITSEDGRYGAFHINGEWIVRRPGTTELGRVCDVYLADALIGIWMDQEMAR